LHLPFQLKRILLWLQTILALPLGLALVVLPIVLVDFIVLLAQFRLVLEPIRIPQGIETMVSG
jgi:hypothetical protein